MLYLDASALVRRYGAEPGTRKVAEAIAQAEVVGTSLLSRAEAAAASVLQVLRGGCKSQGDRHLR